MTRPPVQKTSGRSWGVKSGRRSPLACARSISSRSSGRSRSRAASSRSLSVLPRREDVLEGAVLGVQLHRALEEAAEAGPGVVLFEGALGGGGEGAERVLEDGVDQVLLGGEPPVERPHPDAGALRDLLDRDVDSRRSRTTTRAASRIRSRLARASRRSGAGVVDSVGTRAAYQKAE